MAPPPTLRLVRRCWRVLAPRWAHDPLSGAGAARHGGRWNPPGRPALYMSEDLMTAAAEYEQDLGIRPGTFCAYDLKIGPVADLTDTATAGAWGVAAGDLACPWKQIALIERGTPPTWQHADRLLAAGLCGVRVPSVRQRGGVNVVLWRWNDADDRRVTALDPLNDLPRP